MKNKGLVITLCITLFLAIASPFNVYADNGGMDGVDNDDVSYIAAFNFFESYGLRGQYNNGLYLQCVSGSSTTGYCQIYTSATQQYGGSAQAYNVMRIPSGSSFNTYTAYSTSNRLRLTLEPIYIVFLSTTNFTTSNVTVYPQSGYTVTWTRVTNDAQTLLTPNGYYLVTLKLQANTVPSGGSIWATINLPGTTSTEIVPIYKGSEGSMTDDIHRIVFGTGQTYEISDDETHSILNSIKSLTTTNAVNVQQILSKVEDIRWNFVNGNQEANSTSTSLNNKTSELTTSIDNVTSLESDFIDNMDSSIDDINFTSDLVSNGNLLSSMTWVKQQYDRITVNNVFGSMIQYALLFGLGLLIIGRFK